MPYMVAAIVLVGVLCLVNLLVCLGVVRRLREYAARFDQMSAGSPEIGLAEGASVGAFEAVTLDDIAVSRDDLVGDTVVGFLTTECPPCHERLPEFVEYARGVAGRTRVLAVVIGPADAAPSMVPSLAEVAHVIRDDGGGALSKAFAVRGFPAFFRLAGATVTARGTSIAALPAPSAA
ncbi:TlpA family protein disulfide reductase [Pseudonocardia acaciae]|uniref:TlpA family protein disulfide reductase n=1 Tax=Pseudonocardia acaciae TaxID=551276 RepID=UPI000686D3B1|nr:hypothetical protein [Pseudonocardia acaciae]